MNFRLMFLILPLVSFSFGCWADRAEVRFTAQTHYESNDFPELQVTVRDGTRTIQFVLNETTPTAGPFTTRKSGKLTIDCTVLSDGEEANTHGAVELPLKSDWHWGVDFFIAEENPANICFGCFGARAFELDPKLGYDGSQRFYIVWGGNSISNPVVY